MEIHFQCEEEKLKLLYLHHLTIAILLAYDRVPVFSLSHQHHYNRTYFHMLLRVANKTNTTLLSLMIAEITNMKHMDTYVEQY